MGIGSDAWDRLFGQPRPAELHPFREIKAGSRQAVATPGDLLFHIRAKRMDLCFELATQIVTRLGEAVSPVDEVHGFRYFDDLRSHWLCSDGTRRTQRRKRRSMPLIWAPKMPLAGGEVSVVVQKYLYRCGRLERAVHLKHRSALSGAPKLSDIELDDAVKPTSAHNALTTIIEDGREIKIVRDNMPFGRAAEKEFGTYFIGYARSPRTIEQMLENMFVGRPPGNYDRLLDFSVPQTGNLFFVPSATFLENVGNDAPPAGQRPSDAPALAPPQPTPKRDGSLGIGSLKGDHGS